MLYPELISSQRTLHRHVTYVSVQAAGHTTHPQNRISPNPEDP